MHDFDLILTLTGGLVAAFIGGYVTHRSKLSPIVGYLAAGILVGPFTPGFVADRALAEQLAEIGVILLMFGVGLQFHVEDLLAVRRVAVPGAIVQSLVATALGAAVAYAAGWDLAAGLIFGIALSVASTVVLVRVLSDHRQLHTPAGHIAVGWLVVEDLFTVLVLVLMPAMFGENRDASPFIAISLAIAKVAALTIFTIVAGGRVSVLSMNATSASIKRCNRRCRLRSSGRRSSGSSGTMTRCALVSGSRERWSRDRTEVRRSWNTSAHVTSAQAMTHSSEGKVRGPASAYAPCVRLNSTIPPCTPHAISRRSRGAA